MLEAPPPGVGFTTVIDAVPATAIFAAGTVAVSCELLTNVVASGVPFQLTVAPETKPVPLTVSVKSGPPGATAEGTSGWLTNGTGFVCVQALPGVNPAQRRKVNPVVTR